MAKFLFKATYSNDGIRGVLKEGGSARIAAVEGLAKSLGGTVEVAYFAFGGADLYVIAELPDHAAAAAVVSVARASGAIASGETVVLLTPEEMDRASELKPTYRAPGA